MTNSNGKNGMTLAQLQDQSNQYPTVGWQVFWHLTDISVPHTDLHAIMEHRGLDAYKPKPPSARVVLRDALECWLDSLMRQGLGGGRARGDVTQSSREMIRPQRVPGTDYLVFHLITEKADFAAVDLEYLPSLRVFLDTKADTWYTAAAVGGTTSQQYAAQDAGREIQVHWDRLVGKHDSGSISRILTDVLGDGINGAVCLREQGGLYYLPNTEDAEALLVNLTGFISDLRAYTTGRPSNLFYIGIPDTEQYRDQMADAVYDGLLQEVDILGREFDAVIADDQGKPGSVRRSTIEDRIFKFQLVRAKLDIFSEQLGMQVDTIAKTIGALESRAFDLLSVKMHPDDKPTPAAS